MMGPILKSVNIARAKKQFLTEMEMKCGALNVMVMVLCQKETVDSAKEKEQFFQQ